MKILLIAVLTVVPVNSVWAALLTLEQAEQTALRNDPVLAKVDALRNSQENQAAAVNTWPDPKIKLGVANFPTEEFNFEKLDMTQGVVGIVQRIPPWGAVGAKSLQVRSLSEVTAASYKDRKLQVVRDVRKNWLSVYLWAQSKRLIEASLDIFGQLKKVTRLQYRAGRGKQQDVIRSQLEESLLQDKASDMDEKFEAAVAQLKSSLNVERLEGEMDSQFPQLATLPEETRLDTGLDLHPLTLMEKARIQAAENGVEFAEAQFRPGLSLDVSYGYRGADRGDLVTAMLMLDLPIFTGNKQDKQLNSSQAALTAAKFGLEDVRRKLRQKLDDSLATFRRSNDRIVLYETQLLPQAEQNTEASLSGYQSRVNTFNELVRARLTELNSRLQHLMLKVKRGKAHADLLYLAGGQ